ncbi:MAG: dockerin type I repeat-containing protein [Planctomycetota bacterium]|nr:dockerin type I repeat-containing protein [Planctomycetota bacterium]
MDIYVYGHNGSAQIVSDNPGLGYPGGGVVTNGAQQSMSLNSGLTTYVDGSGGTGNYLKFSDIAVLSNLWVNMTESDWSALQVVKHSGAPPTPANFTATPAGPFDFGPVGVSTISAVQTVTLTNIGGTAGDVTGATVTGGFAFTVPEPGVTPYSVGPAGTAVYGIQLPAQALPGSYAGTATFTTSAGGPFTYDLTATVFAHAGDVNGDGQVSLLDYNIIKANFGNTYESGNHWGDGDVNGDEQVGLLDFNIVKAHFGHTTGDGAAVTAVPEPATLSLLALAGLAALRRKR